MSSKFSIKDATLRIILDSDLAEKTENDEVTGLSEDGFGLTYKSQNVRVPTIGGRVAFYTNIAEEIDITISLLESSVWNSILDSQWKRNSAFKLIVQSPRIKLEIEKAYISSFPDLSYDSMEMPSLEWRVLGFGIVKGE